MNKGTSLALLIIGAGLMIYGFNASDSISSDFSRFFTGAPTQKAIWLLFGGLICFLTGLVGMIRGRPTSV